MGLDIRAYEKARLVKRVDEWTEHEEGELFLYNLEPFIARGDGMPAGIYEPGGKQVSFSAGSYSFYNIWRAELARFVGKTPEEIWRNPKPGPFVELINFADNDGFLGPTTSAKLAADFVAHEKQASAFKSELHRFFELYQDFAKAFATASKEGFVKFT